MNYLTNYYKNLSEQLQEKLNALQKLLNEARNSSVDLDADDSEDYEGDLHGIRHEINSAVDRGIEHIQRLHYHPKITPEHRNKLYDLDSLMMDYSDGSRMTRHPDELSDIHSDAHAALEDIQDIEDELER